MNVIDARCSGVAVPAWLEGAKSFCARILAYLGIQNWEISLLFCGDELMTQLNKSYRNIDDSTDVLSFEQGEPVPVGDGLRRPAGDIVICLDNLRKQAAQFNIAQEDELKQLVIHGVLHLRGMDHVSNNDMIRLQEEIFVALKEEIIF